MIKKNIVLVISLFFNSFSYTNCFINIPITLKPITKKNNMKVLYSHSKTFYNSKEFYTEIKHCNIKLDDVAGMEEAKNEVIDIIDFLKDTDKYIKMGAKLPSGILLSGPPGTGKTLLAKAIAGEAGVPFYATSGSSFVNLYVGIGSANIRKIFFEARSNAPSIIFIDEIDAIGSTRTNSPSKNEERESTLNQLLVEMDGFMTDDKVIVIASTNRPDILDEALVRNGRFDKKILTVNPDKKARFKILNIHARNKPIAKDVDFMKYATDMTNFNGADIRTVLNEATILACRQNSTEVTNNHITNAYQKQIFGSKLYSHEMPDSIQKIVAVHELGHCLMAEHFGFDKVIYVSNIPNSKGSAGITVFRPYEPSAEMNIFNKEYLIARLGVLLGGRVAEEIILGYNKVTTGASKDLHEAKLLVHRIINEFGLGTEIVSSNPEKEKKELLDFMYKKTKQILFSKKHIIEFLAFKLLEEKEIYEDRYNELIKSITKIEEEPPIADAEYAAIGP